MVIRGLSRLSQEGICPLVTMKICRIQGACLSIDRNEYLSSSLSSKRLAEISSSCLDYKTKKSFLDLKNILKRTFKFSSS